MTERTIEQHLECAYKIMKGHDLKDEKNYWDAMSHIHDSYMILKNKPERYSDWKDWCTCEERERKYQEYKKNYDEKMTANGFDRVDHGDGIIGYKKKASKSEIDRLLKDGHLT